VTPGWGDVTTIPKAPKDFEEILGRPALRREELPSGKAALISLAKRQSVLIAPFWQSDGTWIATDQKMIAPRQIVKFGYRLAEDFLVVMAALLERYGVEASESAMHALKGKNPGASPPGLGTRGTRLASVIQPVISMLLAFQIRDDLVKIDRLPPSLVAKTDRLIVLMIKAAAHRHNRDDEIDSNLRNATVLLGLGQLERNFRELGEPATPILLGPFTHLRLGEFAELANRTQVAKSRYGQKKIEIVFEDQLALLAQSLGFYVVRARRATRRVDLLCLSDETTPYTALIEAKTTSRAYAFPTDDQRALVEYVADVRGSLGTLPTVAFVLLVGSSASSTLEAKLGDIEATISLPVRFIDAETLVRLRDRLPGPLPADDFRELLVRSDRRVLDSSFVSKIVGVYNRRQEAHSTFVQALMNAGR
jgi:hypothetical protein